MSMVSIVTILGMLSVPPSVVDIHRGRLFSLFRDQSSNQKAYQKYHKSVIPLSESIPFASNAAAIMDPSAVIM